MFQLALFSESEAAKKLKSKLLSWLSSQNQELPKQIKIKMFQLALFSESEAAKKLKSKLF